MASKRNHFYGYCVRKRCKKELFSLLLERTLVVALAIQVMNTLTLLRIIFTEAQLHMNRYIETYDTQIISTRIFKQGNYFCSAFFI